MLNKLVHPKVGLDFKKWISETEICPFVIKEAALLYESGSYADLDKIVVVSAPEDLRIERVLKRDPHRSREQVKEIIGKQWPEADKVAKADFLIINDEVQMLVPQVIALNDKLTILSRRTT